jgi:hypothetical protein
MSTFIKTAAMSLLSKTLQTLLYKYLSDVDVEGVNLPSLYDSDGHSGWGVRLSNVKLREGVKLLDLPGKPKRKKKKRRRVRRNDAGQASAAADKIADAIVTEQQDETSISGISKQQEADPTAEPIADSNLGTHKAQNGPATTGVPPAKSSGWFSYFYTTPSKPTANDESALTAPVISEENIFERNQTINETSDKANAQLNANAAEESRSSMIESDDDDAASDEDDLPFILRLGQGGSIGTLDMRLVGKDIHVLVEDAFLIIEAVRVRPTEADEKDQQPPQKKKSINIKNIQPETVGDRVLAENAIARLVSSIPNLFLRDIRVQFIIRDEVVDSPLEEQTMMGEDTEYSISDTIVEINIEFLSVTDGEDFLGKYRVAEDYSESDEESSTVDPSDRYSNMEDTDDRYSENQYLVKRIRTGRGPEGGFVCKIYPPGHFGPITELRKKNLWARYNWDTTTRACVIRCSGLDIQSRVFLGTKQDIAGRDIWFTDEHDGYDVDAMLFSGVDYIAPGPYGQSLPLPPITGQEVDLADGAKFWSHEGATTFTTHANNIQSCSVASGFHRVARGLLPTTCEGDHLPCEHCSKCWQGLPTTKMRSPLDNATPMGGLTLSISTRDPLEINIDRFGLEVVGNVLRLFRRNLEDNGNVAEQGAGTSLPGKEDNSARQRDNDTKKPISGADLLRKHVSEDDDENIHATFPTYMQPENIQFIGLHFSDLVFRLHIMREDGTKDDGFAFCYWDVNFKCLTMDYQQLKAPEKTYFDVRLDIGQIQVHEYRGNACKSVVSLGLRQRIVDFDEATIETMKTLEDESNRSPWPSTAAALLDVQPPLETLAYQERDRHGLQLRFVNVARHMIDFTKTRSLLNVRLGAAAIDLLFDIKNQIPIIIKEARTLALGNIPAVKHDKKLMIESLMRYRIHLDGGNFKLEPRLKLRLPLTVVSGEKSATDGLFFETMLERVSLSYGETCSAVRALEHPTGLSLQQLAKLPENVRYTIFIFLDDLAPISEAFCLKREANSFLQCRSLNKVIVRAAKRATKKDKSLDLESDSEPAVNRRQELITELLKLDDESLEQLYRSYLRFGRHNSISNSRR